MKRLSLPSWVWLKDRLKAKSAELIPQAHDITDFILDPYAAQSISRVIMTEHLPRGWYDSVMITDHDLIMMQTEPQILMLLEARFDVAFQGLAERFKRDYDHEVIPWDIPSGE